MNLGPIISQGKTKVVYAHPTDPNLAILYFTDNITAGDGVKKDIVPGKGLIDWRTNKNIFQLLEREFVPTHYVTSPEPQYSIVRRMSRRVPLEVVGRRVGTGSYLDKYPDVKEGKYFPNLVVQFFYKDDGLHDPELDSRFIQVLTEKEKTDVFQLAREHLKKTFVVLENALAKQRHQLIDLKIEVGYAHPEELVVVDEVTTGSLRVWPFADGVNELDSSQSNVLYQLNKGGMLDKQIYREGGPLDKVKSKFEVFAELTDMF
jgi:phosphoribosylaminoimidazole-succinocarboxamide synthase